MLVKQASSFSSQHRILSLRICVRQTARLTRHSGRLQNLVTDAEMCIHCTRQMLVTVTVLCLWRDSVTLISTSLLTPATWCHRRRSREGPQVRTLTIIWLWGSSMAWTLTIICLYHLLTYLNAAVLRVMFQTKCNVTCNVYLVHHKNLTFASFPCYMHFVYLSNF